MRIAPAVATALMAAVLLAACSRPATSPEPPAPTPVEPSRQPIAVRVEQRAGHDWRPVTLQDATAPVGPTEVRLTFTTPVRRQEVERALSGAQPAPVRGLMQWLDDQTLIWSIAEMPPRLDFLLGEAHAADGGALPRGLPSLRVGEPPALVAMDLETGKEQLVAYLPADVSSASLTPDGKGLTGRAWLPGSTPWDWELNDFSLNLQTGQLGAGSNGVEPPPQLRTELENWVVSPQGAIGIGALHGDFVLADVRGGRQQVYRDVITRYTWAHGEMPVDLVWAPDGKRVAALSVKSKQPPLQDLVAVAIPSGERTVLVPDLPLGRSSPRLAWSPDERYMLVGNLLVDLSAKRVTPLAGHTDEARGLWAPGGGQLLYEAQDWGAVAVVDPATGRKRDLGRGMIVAWADKHTVYLIRWAASTTRYTPAGM